ncbi:MAG: Uma2 family endonuclease, partial [Cyanobacteria bacterium J06621_8]
RGNFFYYPDVVVTCNPQDRKRYFLNSSCLIIEVLSPSTQATYKREKLINYQSLDSLQEYVLVSQYEIKAEVYRRDDQENWTIETLDKDQELQLNSVGLTLTMKDIYEDVFSL